MRRGNRKEIVVVGIMVAMWGLRTVGGEGVSMPPQDWDRLRNPSELNQRSLAALFDVLAKRTGQKVVAYLPEEPTEFNRVLFQPQMTVREVMDGVAVSAQLGWGVQGNRICFYRIGGGLAPSASIPSQVTLTRIRGFIGLLGALPSDVREALRAGKVLRLDRLPPLALAQLQELVKADGYSLTPPKTGCLTVSLLCAPHIVVSVAGKETFPLRLYLPYLPPPAQLMTDGAPGSDGILKSADENTSGDRESLPLPDLQSSWKEAQKLLPAGGGKLVQLNGASIWQVGELVSRLRRATREEIYADRRLTNMKLYLSEKQWKAADLLAAVATAGHLQLRRVKEVLFLAEPRSLADDLLTERWLSFVCQEALRGETLKDAPFPARDFVSGSQVLFSELSDEQKQFLLTLASRSGVNTVDALKADNILIRPSLGPMLLLGYYWPTRNSEGERYVLKRVASMPLYWAWEPANFMSEDEGGKK